MKGRLEVIAGPMYAGKTSELIERVRRSKIADKKVKVFKPVIDDRYGECVVGSHNGEEIKAVRVEDSKEIIDKTGSNIEVVAVDEAQFFGEGIVSNAQALAQGGRRVIISGTDQTFRGTPFRPVSDLMAVAESVDKLTAVCRVCGDTASMNQRLDQEGEPAHVEEKTVKVGGEGTYEARCRHCHELKGV